MLGSAAMRTQTTRQPNTSSAAASQSGSTHVDRNPASRARTARSSGNPAWSLAVRAGHRPTCRATSGRRRSAARPRCPPAHRLTGRPSRMATTAADPRYSGTRPAQAASTSRKGRIGDQQVDDAGDSLHLAADRPHDGDQTVHHRVIEQIDDQRLQSPASRRRDARTRNGAARRPGGWERPRAPRPSPGRGRAAAGGHRRGGHGSSALSLIAVAGSSPTTQATERLTQRFRRSSLISATTVDGEVSNARTSRAAMSAGTSPGPPGSGRIVMRPARYVVKTPGRQTPGGPPITARVGAPAAQPRAPSAGRGQLTSAARTTLPMALRGSSSTKRTSRGRL